MIKVITSSVFAAWLEELRDHRARARVITRIRRLEFGNPGDVKSVGEGVSEMRIDYGPGYRVYFKMHGPVVAVVLAGGGKGSQASDIKVAKQIAKSWQ